jgi:hypothetical protein
MSLIYKLELYVPRTHTDLVLRGIFNTGAGKIGNYDQCCFIVEGIGQFRPLVGSTPSIGKENILEKVKEDKIELVIADELVKKVRLAITIYHPYETPAYQLFKVSDIF